MESNQVRQLELRSRALELEMRQRQVEMGRMQAELRDADSRLRTSSERFSDIKQQLLSVQQTRARNASPAEVFYQANTLAERLSHSAKALREQTDTVSAMRARLKESQRQAAMREAQLAKLEARAQEITDRVAQGVERAQSEEILEVSAQVKAQTSERTAENGAPSEQGMKGSAGVGGPQPMLGAPMSIADMLAKMGESPLQSIATLCAGGEEEGVPGAPFGSGCQSDLQAGQLTALVTESNEPSVDLADLSPISEGSQMGVGLASDSVAAMGVAGEHKGAERVAAKSHLNDQEESGVDNTSLAAFGVDTALSSAQAQLAAMAQAGMDMQRQQHGQRNAQAGSGGGNDAGDATRSFSEAVSPALEKQVELLESWDKFSGQGVGFAIKLDSGKSMGVEISAGPAGGVQVVLEPDNNRDRHSLWQQRGEIIEALEEAGCEVKSITVRGRQ